MSALRLVSLSIVAATFAAAASVALASESEATQRAEVRRQVLQARADHQFIRAGEAMQEFPLAPTTSDSMLTRQRVREDTLLARSLGQLVPAGQGGSAFVPPTGTPMARAEVRDSVRQANLDGQLARAGEAMGPVDGVARAHMSRAEIVAMRAHR
jgi:hypothetical protein